MKQKINTMGAELFGKENIWKILLKTAPPIMLAQLIQALYNIVDSYFVGSFSNDGLTALSVIYPIQLIIIALAVGTGVGVNTYMAKQYALKKDEEADAAAGTGFVLEIATWIVFSLLMLLVLRPYVEASAKSENAVKYAVDYGMIISIGSIGMFLESNWTKVHQAQGNMRLPMIAQIAGAVTNIIFDPLLIFGIGIFPELGIRGAAIATVLGQVVAAVIVGVKGFRKSPEFKKIKECSRWIYRLGYPSIFMQLLYTVYIGALNMILAGFCDEAVTVLGLYYKMQSFFFIPLNGLQTCIVPILSYNYSANFKDRCRKIFRDSVIISIVFMVLGVLAFEFLPVQMIGLFSDSERVKEIGLVGFRIIGTSFIPAVFSLMLPVFFQAIGYSKTSSFIAVLRQIICLVPIFWACSRFGLNYCWLAFPLAEIITDVIGLSMYGKLVHKWVREKSVAMEKSLNLEG